MRVTTSQKEANLIALLQSHTHVVLPKLMHFGPDIKHTLIFHQRIYWHVGKRKLNGLRFDSIHEGKFKL